MELKFLDGLARATSRRNFLQWSGLTIAVAAVGCSDDNGNVGPNPTGAVDLGSGDTGILNYAYALEQLEAAFYTMVVSNASFTAIFSAEEQVILTDIRDHEIAHREFFKAALSTSAIAALEVDFSSINFGNRESVLN